MGPPPFGFTEAQGARREDHRNQSSAFKDRIHRMLRNAIAAPAFGAGRAIAPRRPVAARAVVRLRTHAALRKVHTHTHHAQPLSARRAAQTISKSLQARVHTYTQSSGTTCLGHIRILSRRRERCDPAGSARANRLPLGIVRVLLCHECAYQCVGPSGREAGIAPRRHWAGVWWASLGDLPRDTGSSPRRAPRPVPWRRDLTVQGAVIAIFERALRG